MGEFRLTKCSRYLVRALKHILGPGLPRYCGNAMKPLDGQTDRQTTRASEILSRSTAFAWAISCAVLRRLVPGGDSVAGAAAAGSSPSSATSADRRRDGRDDAHRRLGKPGASEAVYLMQCLVWRAGNGNRKLFTPCELAPSFSVRFPEI